MGFLLGRLGDSSLTEFETTNQDIKHNDFEINERSVDKSLQSYSFREKLFAQYEFQFMTDTEYKNLLYLVKHRNSLRPNLVLLPIPYSHEYAKCIYLPDGINNICSYGMTVNSTTYPWNIPLNSLIQTEITANDYAKINTYDSNYIRQDGDDGVPYYVFQFPLGDFTSAFSYQELRRLTLTWVGMNSSPYRFFIWSPLRSTWFLMDDKFHNDSTSFDIPSGNGAFSLYKGLVTGFSCPPGYDSIKDGFLDGNNIINIMVSAAKGFSPIMLQYVRLFVNGFYVKALSPQSFENYSTSFTGAGRTGNLMLEEL